MENVNSVTLYVENRSVAPAFARKTYTIASRAHVSVAVQSHHHSPLETHTFTPEVRVRRGTLRTGQRIQHGTAGLHDVAVLEQQHDRSVNEHPLAIG